jgi:manganese/zinc/iron transport system permease protein
MLSALTATWFIRALTAGSLVAVGCSVIGVFLYLRRMSMIADALAHIALLGILLAVLVTGGISSNAILLGAVATGALATVLMQRLTDSGVREDSAIGIVFTSAFSLGVVLLNTRFRSVHIDTDCVLFGDILGIEDQTLLSLGLVAAMIIGGVFVLRRWLVLSTFDPIVAATVGVPVVFVHHAIVVGSSFAAVAAFQAVGAVLAVALMIIPAATAHQLSHRLPTMLAVAVGHALASTWIGLALSVAAGTRPSGTIVCVAGSLYILALVAAPRYGVIAERITAGEAA